MARILLSALVLGAGNTYAQGMEATRLGELLDALEARAAALAPLLDARAQRQRRDALCAAEITTGIPSGPLKSAEEQAAATTALASAAAAGTPASPPDATALALTRTDEERVQAVQALQLALNAACPPRTLLSIFKDLTDQGALARWRSDAALHLRAAQVLLAWISGP